jgi:citrate lyase subunit beta/citryl-CoA lyase
MMRSWLFAPANHPRRVENALTLGADVVVLDLEDACPEAEKDAARTAVRTALGAPRRGLGYARINAWRSGRAEADLQAIVGEALDGILLPKAETAVELQAADHLIGLLERRRGLRVGRIDLVPLIETAVAVADVRSIARASPRVRRFAFGSADFAIDLGLTPGPDELELLSYRAALVLAAKTGGLEAPIDSAWLSLGDDDVMTRAMGFQGKLCIHPSQVRIANAAFAPTPAEAVRAARIVEAFEAAEARGSAAISVDGQLVDYPIFRRAKQVLAAAAAVPSA